MKKLTILIVLMLGAGVAFAAVPDVTTAPADSASFLWKLYKAGHLIPAIVVALFFGLGLASKWIPWLRTGYRKLLAASALAGLGMLAEGVADGTSPNIKMIMGAIGVALALYIKGEGEKPAEQA